MASAERTLQGPEIPTLIERLVGKFHLPYIAGATLLSLLVGWGSPGSFLFQLLDTFEFDKAYRRFVELPGLQGLQSNSTSQLFLVVVGSTSAQILVLWLIRFMRLRVVDAEPKLLQMIPQGEDFFHRIFGRISRPKPVILLSVLFGLVSLPFFVELRLSSILGPFGYLDFILSNIVTILTFATFVWIYFSSVWGLHRLGKTPLNIKSFYHDRMMGLRPVGSLSLALAFAFFLGFAILFLLSFIIPPATATQAYVAFAFLAIPIVFGIAMFFLPVNGLHLQMARVKQQEQERLGSLLAKSMGNNATNDPNDSRLDSAKLIADLKSVIVLEIAERRVSSIPTWPFDTGVLGRLFAIVLSVTAIVLSKYVTIALGIK